MPTALKLCLDDTLCALALGLYSVVFNDIAGLTPTGYYITLTSLPPFTHYRQCSKVQEAEALTARESCHRGPERVEVTSPTTRREAESAASSRRL